jgi:HAD superfamily hydrolase (TIGR01509 family)
MQEISNLLDENHHLHTSIEAENEQFRKYFRLALEMLGHHSPDDALIEELVRKQADPEWYLVYDETIPVLDELRKRGYIIHMLSNSFLYLEDIMRVKGLDGYFDGWTISARVGCMKPDDRIFQAAFDSMGIPPENMLYVDDIASFVLKGISLGMQGFVMDRFDRQKVDGAPTISNLRELLNLLPSIPRISH